MNRMRLWRTKKTSQEAGRLTQVCVWAPEQDAEFVRQICARVAEPTVRGYDLRKTLQQQLDRRRTLYTEWSGFDCKAEIDYPFVGPWWFMRNIGGRIIGSLGTHIELSPEEATGLKDRLRRACQHEIDAWMREQKLVGVVRDHTGVVISQPVDIEGEDKDIRRPADDVEFAANEARIARSVNEAAVASRKPPVKDPSVIEYEGFHGFPSFCQIAHRRHEGRVQFALIHMPNGGTSPTNMIESLATHLRQHFYPKVDPGLIDWFDVVPPNTYYGMDLAINYVTMQHANGVYSHPSWRGTNENLAEDWVAFVLDTIARGQKARDIADSAPHDEHAASKHGVVP